MRIRLDRVATPFAFALVVVIGAPAVLHAYAGLTVRIIRSGSMAPALQAGDAVLVHAVPATDLVEGDIALLFHPQDSEIEAHRILTVDESNTGLTVVTKGDANPMSDVAVAVPRQAAIERVVVGLPKLGYILTVFGSSEVLGSLCALGLMVLIAFEIQDRRRKSAATEPITQK